MRRSLGRTARHDVRRPLFWLGAVLPVCFIAGITGATIPTQWPLLSIVLPFALWRRGRMTLLHWIGLGFFAYAALSVTWSPNPVFAIWGLWQIAIWGLAFWLGSTSPSLAPLWRGMAIGLGVSSCVAVAQALGWQGVPSLERPAGLLYSGPLQGAMIALVTVALCCDRAWPYIPAMLPGLWLAHSRGGVLVLLVGLLARWNWGIAVATTGIAAAAVVATIGPSDVERLQTWSIALHNITPWGYGAGGFAQLVYLRAADGILVHPEFVHNDYLELAFDYGFGALPAFAIVVAALGCRHNRIWPVFAAFCTLALFYFPLFTAPLAFIGAVVAGHLLRRHDGAWLARHISRSRVMAWPPRAWRAAVSVPSRNPPATTGAVDAAR